jgi:lauroyl/myristoyl acyltransferase
VADAPAKATAPSWKSLLRQTEFFGYWLVVAPLAARLPARVAYGIACLRGDLGSRFWPEKRTEIAGTLRRGLGDELTPEEAERLARRILRVRSCEVIDLVRLHGRARSLGRLVAIRGREHLEAALAGGKGAILCGAHFGSYNCAFSLLHASGFPVTSIGRWGWHFRPEVPPHMRRFWDFVYARRLLRHRTRPNIQPWPGRVSVAVEAAAVLRANEAVTICCDAAPVGPDRARAIEVPLLGMKVGLLPGVAAIARVTGAPVLMVLMRRSADYRHQVLEISPPVPMQGDTVTAFGRCIAELESAIKASPADWYFFFDADDLASLQRAPGGSADPGSARQPAAAVREPE